MNLKQELVQNIRTSKLVKYLTTGFLIFIPLLFYSLWIGKLLPLMRIGEKLEFTHSIFILDMVFVLPFFIISATLIITRNGLGYIFAPILFFKAFTLLFSVGLGGFIKLLYNQIANQSESMFYIILSVIFLALAVLNFWKIEFQKYVKS